MNNFGKCTKSFTSNKVVSKIVSIVDCHFKTATIVTYLKQKKK